MVNPTPFASVIVNSKIEAKNSFSVLNEENVATTNRKMAENSRTVEEVEDGQTIVGSTHSPKIPIEENFEVGSDEVVNGLIRKENVQHNDKKQYAGNK